MNLFLEVCGFLFWLGTSFITLLLITRGKVNFVKQDLWFGVYWKLEDSLFNGKDYYRKKFYICIIPTLPIIIATRWRRKL